MYVNIIANLCRVINEYINKLNIKTNVGDKDRNDNILDERVSHTT